MKRRIFGLETEYAATALKEDGSSINDGEVASHELFQDALKRGLSTNIYLENGGRLYLDVGAHPEYATAECTTLEDLVAQDEAGIAHLQEMAQNANARLAKSTKLRIHLLKNNLDSAGNSCGCHENYLILRHEKFRQFADSMVTFLITRQIVTGSGCFGWDGKQITYGFWQRATIMQDAISAATTRTRPLINTRDEPLADSHKYRRLHVISGDSNVSQLSGALKVFITTLMLDAVEEGTDFSDLTLADPMHAVRQVSRDLSAKHPFTCVTKQGERKTNALEVQKEIRSRLRDFFDPATATALQLQCWDLWGLALDCIAEGDFQSVQTQLDWAIKYRLWQRFSRLRGAVDFGQIRTLDYAYHDITNPLSTKLIQAGEMAQVVSPQQVQAAKTNPPANTRAFLRGKTIALAKKYRRDLNADWMHLRLPQSTLPTVVLSDPFATQDEAVERLWEEIIAAKS